MEVFFSFRYRSKKKKPVLVCKHITILALYLSLYLLFTVVVFDETSG